MASRSREGSWGHPFSSLFQTPAATFHPCRPTHSSLRNRSRDYVFLKALDTVCPGALHEVPVLPSGVCGVQTPISADLVLYLGVHICEVGLIIMSTDGLGDWSGVKA